VPVINYWLQCSVDQQIRMMSLGSLNGMMSASVQERHAGIG